MVASLLLAACSLLVLQGCLGFAPSLPHACSSQRSTALHVAAPPQPQTAAVSTDEEAAPIILSTTERARTVTHVANYGTLCTTSLEEVEGLAGSPFGSHVDYVLDSNGWPTFLLAEASMHTRNIKANSKVSLLVQTPKLVDSQVTAALSRVTMVGHIVEVDDDDELIQLKATFSLVHQYADQLVQSPQFKFYKLSPDMVYYVGGFGVQSRWLDVPAYEKAQPDILADEAPKIVARVNKEQVDDIALVCKQFLKLKVVNSAVVTTVDRLGFDLRVKSGELTDEFRIGFSQKVTSVEDAKSEIVKVFQEAWEKEQGVEWVGQGPPVQRYAEDILRKRQ
ncbi:unnamed protein product [Chrysoparadoxa australica]